MEKFIGTKIVQAYPAYRYTMLSGCYVYVPHDEDNPQMLGATACEDGYRVIYQDGYQSWSPKEAFEQAYRQVDGMNFGLALEAAKKGKKIARKGWNGKGMYVFLIDIADMHTDADIGNLEGKDVTVMDCLAMKCADDSICPGWLASQTDMLADDWMLLPDCGMMSWPQAEEAIKEGKAVCRKADGWEGVHFVGLIEEPEELAGKVCMVTRDGTIHPDWQPGPDDLTGSDWFEVYLG